MSSSVDCGKAVSCKEERVDQEIFMDTNNSRPTPPNGKPDFDSGDWRAKMPTKTRQTLVKTITGTLKRNLPFCGQEGGLNELEKIAMMIEESDFAAASSAPDYLWRISLKLISMDTRCRNKVLPESDPNNMASAGVQSSAVPFVSGPSQNHVSDVVAQNSDVQNVSGFSQDSMWQGRPSNIVADQMMQIQGRQQVVPQQELQGNLQSSLVQSHIQQQPQGDLQSSLVQPHMQQQQPQGDLQSSLVQSHMQQQQPQENLQSSLVQSHMQQQQQQNILQPSQLNSSQQSDSTAQMEHANVSDQQERAYQKLKAMKDAYLPEIQVMHQKISAKLLKYDSLPLQLTPEKLDKLKLFATLLERVMHMLTFSRDSIVLANEERLNLYEEQIRKFIHTCREARKPVSALQQEQDQVDNQMNPQSPGPGDAIGSMQQHVAPATYEQAGFEYPAPEPAANGVSTMSIPRFSTDFIKPNAEKPHDPTANSHALGSMQQVAPGTYEQARFEYPAPEPAVNGMSTMSIPSFSTDFIKTNVAEKPHYPTTNKVSSHALGSMQQQVVPGTYEQAEFEYPAPEPAANGMSTMFNKPNVAEKQHDPTANKANDNSLRSTVVTIVDEASTVVGEDLAAVRKQGLLAFTQTGMSGAFKIRCYLSALVILALIICFVFKLNHQ